MKSKGYIIIGILGLSAFQSCKNEQPQAPPPASLPVIEATQRDMTSYQTFPVSIEGKVNNAVRAKISGYITQVFVDEGQFVSKGQPLFKLETNVQAQDANAAKSGINAAQANIAAAQAAVNAAQVEVDKLIPLVEKKIISNVQLETAKANLMRAEGQLAQAKAARQQAQANYSGIQANINFGVVRSPISGIVGAINFREGSLVGPSDPTPITTVSETGEVYAYFSMNEREYLDFLSETEGTNVKEKLKNIPEVDLIMANDEIYPEKGKIQTVTGQINPQTGTIQFRASFANKDGLLSNGNSGIIRIPKSYKNAVIIPESATFEQQGLVYVYTVEKDTARATKVEIIDRAHNFALIKSGVKSGDKVIAEGTGKVKSGTPVTSIPTNIDSVANSIQPIF